MVMKCTQLLKCRSHHIFTTHVRANIFKVATPEQGKSLKVATMKNNKRIKLHKICAISSKVMQNSVHITSSRKINFVVLKERNTFADMRRPDCRDLRWERFFNLVARDWSFTTPGEASQVLLSNFGPVTWALHGYHGYWPHGYIHILFE